MKLKIVLVILSIIILLFSSSSQSLLYINKLAKEKTFEIKPLGNPAVPSNLLNNPPLGDIYRITREDEIAVLGRWNYDYTKAVKIIQDNGKEYMDWKEPPNSGNFWYGAIDAGYFEEGKSNEIVLLRNDTENIWVEVWNPSNNDSKWFKVTGKKWGCDITCGDFNGDGIDEIAILAGNWFSAKYIKIVDNNGNTIKDWQPINPAGDHVSYYRIDAGDVDGDGVDELVALTTNRIYIKDNVISGNPSNDVSKSIDIDGKCVDVACGNLNNDEKDEIAVLGYVGKYQDDIEILDVNGNILSKWKNPPDKLGYSAIATGDLDRDGDDELVLMYRGTYPSCKVEIWDPLDNDNPYPHNTYNIGSDEYFGYDIACGDFDNDSIFGKYTGKSKTATTDPYPVVVMYWPPCKKGGNDDFYDTYSAYAEFRSYKKSESNSVAVEATYALSFEGKLPFLTSKVGIEMKNKIEHTYENSYEITYMTGYKTAEKKDVYVITERTTYEQYKYKIINGPQSGKDFAVDIPVDVEVCNFVLSYYNENRGRAPEIKAEHVADDPTSYTFKNNTGADSSLETHWIVADQGRKEFEIEISVDKLNEFTLEEGVSLTAGISSSGFEYSQTIGLYKSSTHSIEVGKETVFGGGLAALDENIWKKWTYKFKMYIRRDPTYKYVIIDYYVDPNSLGWGYTGDTEPPQISIIKPRNYLYIFDREIMPLSGRAITIGGITVECSAFDNKSGIDKVEFYVDEKLVKTVKGSKEMYSWRWNTFSVGLHKLTVKAFDKAENCADSSMNVFTLII
ncbi:MAG: hypothetical protein DRJ99_01005 [Thermoplasmata archaeon]|nr:MAG: hypothetical protein DRJ99_01005 [Thermoplasmata archaeon]